MKNQHVASKHLVVTVHGIRTFGAWQERLEAILTDADPQIEVFHYKYGYFSMLAFVIPFLRWLVTRRFRHELLRFTAKRKWSRIDIVAHSFGTHLVGWGLGGIPAEERPHIHTLILAGSVLKSGFRWDNMLGDTVHRLINDCGSKDKVLLLNQLVVMFSGMAGRVGFKGMIGHDFRNRYFAFGHSGYFQTKGDSDDTFMRANWQPLLLSDEPIVDFADPLPSTALRGFMTFVFNNAEPIKILLWITPLIAIIFYINQQRLIAVDQQQIAEKQTQIADRERDSARRFLGQVYVANGVGLSGDGDGWGALTWFFEALKADRDDPIRKHEHRVRIATHMRSLPHLVQVFRHNSHVNFARFSADGRYVATASGEPYSSGFMFGYPKGAFSVWDLQTGLQLKGPVVLERTLHAVDFSPDGKRLLIAGEEGIAQQWDLKSEKFLNKPMHDGGTIRRAFYLSGGHQIVTAGQRAIVWDADSGQELFATGRTDCSVWDVEMNIDQTSLVTSLASPLSDGWGCPPEVWDLKTRTHVVAEQDAGKWTYASAFSPDGRLVASAGTGGAWIWDAETGKNVVEALGHMGTVRDVVFRPDGAQLLTAGLDGRAMVWDPYGNPVTIPGKDFKQLIFDHGQPILVAEYSPDGLSVLTLATDGTVRLWNSLSGAPVGPELPFSLTRYRSESEGWIGTRAGEEAYATFSPEGRRIVVTGWDGIARLWDLSTGELVHGPIKPTVRAWFSSGAISSRVDGLRVNEILASGTLASIDGSLWSMENGLPAEESDVPQQQLEKDHLPKIPSVKSGLAHLTSPYRFEVDKRGVARILRVGSGVPVTSLHPPDPSHERFDKSTRSAFSPDGRWVATGGIDGGARVWHVETGQPITPILKHSGAVESIRFGTGARLLNIIADNGAWVWNLEADKRSVEQLDRLSAFLGARQLDSSGALVPITMSSFRDEWETLRETQPETFLVSQPDRIAWHLRSAAQAESQRNWPGAQLHLNWLLENDVPRWPLMQRLALASREQGDFDSALDGYNQAIDGGATHWLAWYHRSQLHLKRKAWSDACADYEVIVDRSPWNRQVASDLVLLAAINKQPTAFNKLVNYLIKHAQTGVLDQVVLKARITRPMLLPDPDAALTVFKQHFSKANKALSHQQLLAPLLYRSGRYQEARDAFAELKSKKGRLTDPWLQVFYAMTFSRLGQTDQAVALLAQAERSLRHRSKNIWRDAILLETIVKEAQNLIGK